jgi:hypothetical protein
MRVTLTAALFALGCLAGCESYRCHQACADVEETASQGNWNTAPRLTDCDVLCAHPVAASFTRCCDEAYPLACMESATTSVQLTSNAQMWEWIPTSISVDPEGDLVRIESVLAVSAGLTGCVPDPALALVHELPLPPVDATEIDPVAQSPLSLAEYEAAKWEALRAGRWVVDLPDGGTASTPTSDFHSVTYADEPWAQTLIWFEPARGDPVYGYLRLPLCPTP